MGWGEWLGHLGKSRMTEGGGVEGHGIDFNVVMVYGLHAPKSFNHVCMLFILFSQSLEHQKPSTFWAGSSASSL